MVKKSVSIGLTETQRKLIDYAIDDHYHGHDISVSKYIGDLIHEDITHMLGLPFEENISDEMLLHLCEEYEIRRICNQISFVGIKQYKLFIEKCEKEKSVKFSKVTYEAIKKYEKELSEGQREERKELKDSIREGLGSE